MKNQLKFTRTTIFALLILGVAFIALILVVLIRPNLSDAKVVSYAECAKKPGSKIQESYPRVCVTEDGQRFTNPEDKNSNNLANPFRSSN